MHGSGRGYGAGDGFDSYPPGGSGPYEPRGYAGQGSVGYGGPTEGGHYYQSSYDSGGGGYPPYSRPDPYASYSGQQYASQGGRAGPQFAGPFGSPSPRGAWDPRGPAPEQALGGRGANYQQFASPSAGREPWGLRV